MEEYEEAQRKSKKRTLLATNVACGQMGEATTHAKYTVGFNAVKRRHRR